MKPVTIYKAENTPTKATGSNTASWFNTVVDLASRGVSNKAIATRLGITMEDFIALMNYEQNGKKPVQDAMDLARAEFEISRVEMKDQMLMDPEVSVALKYKIVREDLKTLESWAPATRSVKVTIEKAPTEFSFDSYTDEELNQIAAAAASSDNSDKSDSQEGESES